ncbi:hypothetical protein M441DRAFT_147130 [Trichoderma asperellum CBS 433.97]|uniref:Uncharacterized protein n=1 Tax=Trichoderma asperellum (strain ATCC 204424 / CBS 433.97 / NBRC 101777) TaxID=1042311 RepID=A0A2T3Z038_TRIA4|nr:hypothetical protein M441DRAFT_147130 [Trichoderma asperellum CBS 433.97]PTB38130.1 hypothetical protein M441DRAFT_147130 [Trichoderma asperellum CBS 433.97]
MSDRDGPGSRPPRLGTYQQIVSLKRKPIQARAGPYHQAAQTDDQAEIEDEDEAVSVPTPYGSDAGVVAEIASTTTTQYSLAPPAKSPQSSRSNLWMPIWLSPAALIAFAVTFFLMLLTTALLYHFSEQGNGISAQREANHYAWKYGPTAVLVVVGALWRQVDFANKILTPWEELKTGPSSADKTLLLDYISPILPVSLWMAIKNRHWAVVISIVGQLLILGTTVFSTGFLILEPTTLTKTDETFQLSSKFQLSQSVNPKNAWDVGPGPAQTYYGINFYGLRFPAGTSQDFVVPEFRVPSGAASGFEYSVSTDGLQVNYDCELLPITNGTEASMPWRSIMASFIVANVTTKDCEIKGVTMAEGADHSYYHDPNATQNYQARFDLYPCNVDFDFSRGYIPPENTTLEDQIYNPNNDMRLFMSVADVRIAPSSTPNRYLYLHNVTTALCKPTYEILQFNVSVPSNVNGSAQALSSTPPAKKQVLQSYPPGSLAMAVTDTTNRWDLGTGGVDYVLSTTVPTFFQLMSKKAGFQSIRNFMDPELLISTGTEVFKGIAAQVLHEVLVQPANRTTTGSITYTEQRLHAKALSTGFMCSFLGLLVILSLLMIFVRPSFSAPDKPVAAFSTATILASSPELDKILSPMGHLSNDKLQQRLGDYRFRADHVSNTDSGIYIEPIQRKEGQTYTDHVTEQGQRQVPSWRPMASTTWFLVLAICLPLSIIASLEVVQHFSDINNGFISINRSSALAFATYIPSAVALGVAGLYSAMQMMTAIFAPFAPLKGGKANAKRTVELSLVAQLPPHSLFLSLRTRNFAVAIALFGSFIGSFLSIIVSGLYSVIEVPIVQTVALQQGDVFNFNNVDLSLTDNEAAAIDNLVEYLGLNSTQWTNGNLAFNALKQDVTFTTNSSADVPLTVNVPAVRPSLNCTSIPNDLRKVTIFNQENEESGTMMFQMPGQNAMVSPSDGYVWVGVNTTLKYAEWCETAPKGMKSQEPWMQYFLLPNDTSMAYVGKASILTWGGGLVYGDGAVDTNPTHGQAADGIQETDNGCPTFAVTFGQMKLKKSGKGSKSKTIGFEQDLATLICYQNIVQVMTNATWQLPNLSFDPTQLPKANESTKELLKTSRGSERFPFLPNAWLNGLSNPLINQTIPGPNNSNSSNNYIDNFIEALVMTKNGRPADELAGAANVENLRNATQRLYGRYMAQAISLNMRDNSTAKNLPMYNGQVTISGNQRLQQSSGSKIALQVVLAVMAACAIATRLLLPVRDVLPHNPCSIAGTATLIAGGEMVSRIADNRMDMDDLLHNGLYSLKWWRDEKGAERYGIDLEPNL